MVNPAANPNVERRRRKNKYEPMPVAMFPSRTIGHKRPATETAMASMQEGIKIAIPAEPNAAMDQFLKGSRRASLFIDVGDSTTT